MRTNKQNIGDTHTPEQYNQFLESGPIPKPLLIERCERLFKIISNDGGEDLINFIIGQGFKLVFESAHEAFQAIQKYFKAWQTQSAIVEPH